MGTCSKNLNLIIRVLDLVNPPNNNHHVHPWYTLEYPISF